MDTGGSSFPYGGSVNPMGMGSRIPVGRGRSGHSSPNFVCPINGRTCPGPTFMGVDLGNGIIPPVGSLEAACSCLCCFLEFLLSVCSTDSESDSDSHSHHLGDTGEALCFPKDLTSIQRFLSSVSSSDCFVSTLRQQFSLRGEFLLKSFDTLCCVLVLILIPG